MSVYRINGTYLVIFFAYLITVVYGGSESSRSIHIPQFTGIGLPTYDKMIQEMGTFMSLKVQRVKINQPLDLEYEGEITIIQERHPINVVSYSIIHSVPSQTTSADTSTASGSQFEQAESDNTTNNRVIQFYTPQLLRGKYDVYTDTMELELTNDFVYEIIFEKIEDAKHFSSYFLAVDDETDETDDYRQYIRSQKTLIPEIPIGMKILNANVNKHTPEHANTTYDNISILLLINKNSTGEITFSIELSNEPIPIILHTMTRSDFRSVEFMGTIGTALKMKFDLKPNVNNISDIILEFLCWNDYAVIAACLKNN